jgi:hypothetical protein
VYYHKTSFISNGCQALYGSDERINNNNNNNNNNNIPCFSLSPYSFDVSPSCTDAPHVTHDSIPIGAIPIFASSTPEYQDAVSRVISGANTVYQEFLKSEEGRGFNGQICFVGKC